MKEKQAFLPVGFLEVHCHSAGLFFAQFTYFPVHNTVHSLAHVEYARPVCGDDARAILVVVHDIAQDSPFRCDIQSGRGFVQQQHRCVPQQCTCDGDTLCLAFGKPSAAFTDGTVDAFRQLLYKVPRTGCLQAFDDFFICSIFLHNAHVLGNGAGEDGIALRYIGEVPADVCVAGDEFTGLCDDAGCTRLRYDKAEDQADHRCLALAGRTDQRNDFTRSSLEVHVLQDRGVRGIAEVYIVHPDRQAVKALRIHGEMLFLGQFRKLLDPVRGDGCSEERRDDGDDIVEGCGHPGTLGEEERHGTVGDLMIPEQVQAVAEHSELDDPPYRAHEDVRLDGEQVVVQIDILVLVLPVPQLSAVQRGDAEGLDGIHVVEGFYFKGHDLGGHFSCLFVVFPLPADHEAAHEDHDRCGGEGQDSHEVAVVPDDYEGSDEIPESNDDVGDPVHGIAGDGAYIVVEAVEEITVAVGGDIQPLCVHDLVEDIGLDFVVDAEGELRRDPVEYAGEDDVEHGASHRYGYEHAQLFVLVAGNDINDVFAYYAGNQGEGGAEDAQDGVEDDCAFISSGIGKDELPVIHDLAESAFLPASIEDVKGLEGCVFVGFVG